MLCVELCCNEIFSITSPESISELDHTASLVISEVIIDTYAIAIVFKIGVLN